MGKGGKQNRIGLLGGTFDPIHMGHLVLAERAADALGLDSVLFIPAGSPPHKQGRSITSVEHRLKMTELAIAGNHRFQVSRVDMERPGLSYTVDTLRLIQAQHPAAELVFITGADSLREMGTWYQPETILSLSVVAAANRPGFPLDSLERELGPLYERFRHRIVIFESPLLQISSTELREIVAGGESIRYLVPEPVYEWIHQNGLYRPRVEKRT